MAKKHYKSNRGRATTKSADKSKIVKVVALLLVVLAIAYVITSLAFGGVWNPLKWTSKKTPTDTGADDTSQDNISIAYTTLTADDFAAYGVSENAISAGVLRVEYSPANTSNKRTGFNWGFAGNEWSTGKNIADYVKFTAGANYAPECTYEVLQPFGDTIIVEATSRANSALKATTHIEYMARYSDIWNGEDLVLNYGEKIDLFKDLYADDIYSVSPDSFSANVTVSLNSDFNTWLRENGHYDSAWDGETIVFENLIESIDYKQICDVAEGLNDSLFAEYYYAVGSNTVIWNFDLTVTCNYQGKVVYTFKIRKDVYFSVAALEQMTIPADNMNFVDGNTVII